MGEIRLGLVGLGKIARDQHLPAIAATPGIALAGIASRHAGLPDLPSFATLGELLASGTPIDAVALCTPPQGRHELAAQALAAGKHVLLEKPPGATLAEIGQVLRHRDPDTTRLYAKVDVDTLRGLGAAWPGGVP